MTAESADLKDLEPKWGRFLLLGVAQVVLGMVALTIPWLVTIVSVVFYGWLLLFAGIFELATAFRTRGWNLVLHLLGGILTLVVGGLMAFRPDAGAVAITLLLAAMFLTGGFFRIGAALGIRFPNWGWTVAGGAVSVILGVLIWREWPFSALWVIGTFIAIELLIRGWAWVMLAFALRERSKPHASPQGRPLAQQT